MNTIRIIWSSILEALFPLSKEEEEIASLSREEALRILPPAPPYDASAAQLPHQTLSAFAYKDPRVARHVWNIKYKNDSHAADVGAYALISELRRLGHKQYIIVPMPSTPRRRRERGYNQCEFLADAMHTLEDKNMLVIEKGLLRRIRHTSHQKLKGRSNRLIGARGIFEVDAETALRISSGPLLGNARMIVLDDVITTGSTMREAIDELKKAGFDAAGLSLAH